MQFEYKVKIFSMNDLNEKGIVVDSENNIVYACRTDGACEIHDVKMEQLDNLSSVLNMMGEEGWELVQLVFHQSGIVSFWKRSIEKGNNNTRI
jgi:hypothetical protein